MNLPEYKKLILNLESFREVIMLSCDSTADFVFSRLVGFHVPITYPHGTTIWQRDNNSNDYVRFLLQIPYEHIEDESTQHVLHKKANEIAGIYGVPSAFVCEYLLTTRDPSDNILYDYYDAYAEIPVKK